jgi:integrase/recombinase XerC
VDLIDRYISYVRDVRRYSERTVVSYGEILRAFAHFVAERSGGSVDTGAVCSGDGIMLSDRELVAALNPSELRSYEVYMLDNKGDKPSTVNLHLSVLSGFCNYLVRQDLLKHNPVRLVSRPKVEKRLPEFFRQDAMEGYFERTKEFIRDEDLAAFINEPDTKSGKILYEQRLFRLIVSLLYSLGLRRSELIGLRIRDVDFSRKVVNVIGKGNKSRAIPMDDVLADEILLYLKAVEALVEGDRPASEPLLITYSGRELYPAYVDRIVKKELGDSTAFAGRKSPHVLRHSIATGLLNEGAELNSIKEMLGHSSLAATQVYTHNSIAKLQKVYKDAHPRATSKKD